MQPWQRATFRTLSLVSIAGLLAACPNGGIPPKANTTSATIGAAGGMVVSSDGLFSICIPPMALTQPTKVTVVEHPESSDYSIGEDLNFLVPAHIKLKTTPTECQSQQMGFDSGTVADQTVDIQGDGVNSASYTGTISSEVMSTSSTENYCEDLFSSGDFEILVDPAIVQSGLIEGVTQTIPVTVQSVVTGAPLTGSLEWRVDFSDYAVTQNGAAFPPGFSPFNGTSSPSSLTDQFELTCVPGQPATGHFTVSVRAIDFFAAGKSLTLNCRLPMTCALPINPDPFSLPADDVYHPLLTADRPENLEVVPPAAGSAPRSGPGAVAPNLELMVGGQPAGTTGKAILKMDAVTGQILKDIQFPDFAGTLTPSAVFDGYFLDPSPGGANLGALVLAGNSRFLTNLDANGDPAPFGQINSNTFLHSPLIANDPTLGVVFSNDFSGVALSPTLGLYRPNLLSGNFELEVDAVLIPNALRSVASNAAGDEFVGLLSTGGFVWIQDVPGSSSLETLILAGPNHHGRIRWDPASGIGAYSDFVLSTVTAFSWSGNGAPTILDTASVGDGPVGLGVNGHRIAAAGFNDNTLTRMELDPTSGLFTMVDILPNPFAADGASGPGHIRLVTPEAAAISYNLSGGVGILPHFYAAAP